MFEFLKNMFSNKTNDVLKQIINDGAFLVDVRSTTEFANGHIKGSVNIPVDEIQNHLAKFKNRKNIVVFCRSGARSSLAKSVLEKNGIEGVTNGGSWQNVEALLSN